MSVITIIYIYRNRDTERVRRSLDSLREQENGSFNVVFVDYGSDAPFRDAVRKLVESYSFCKYVYNDTRGMPWNRAHALNTGIRMCTSGYFFTADIDMVFNHRFADVLHRLADPARAIFFRVYYLPEGFKEWSGLEGKRFPKSEDFALGLALIPADKAMEIRGYDEFYCYWGAEDNDMQYRLKQAGLDTGFYEDDVLMYHQFHPRTVTSAASFPSGWGAFQLAYLEDMKAHPQRNPRGWGKTHAYGTREAWKMLEKNPEADRIDCTRIFLQYKLAHLFNTAAPGHPVVAEFTAEKSRSYGRSKLNRFLAMKQRAFDFLRVPVELRSRYRHLYQTVYEARDVLILFILSNRSRITDYAFTVENNTLRFVILKA